MPSFFAKVFGRKKDEKESPTAHTRRHSASASLLEGKYEAVSPTASPSADKFTHELGHHSRDREKDAGFSLFRPRSRSTASPKSDNAKPATRKPHLELNLTVQKEAKPRALGVVFEATDDRGNLPEAVVGERRLSPQETYQLVKACAAAIIDRGGLETLGVMHPHWYSASPDAQRRLISLFILSLTSLNSTPLTTLSPTPDTPFALFDSELTYTRSSHDIAAVLRWALRHLRLESPSFGLNPDGEDTWKWYASFLEAERSSNYPTHAFSQSLVPSIPQPHLQLLTATLDIIASLAAHAETNGNSGSKLTNFFGLWLLTPQRALETDDWTAFYARWERAGRILEHLFLSYVRDEAEKKKIPLRLTELVKHYPYASSAGEAGDGLLPRPRFSTRRYDALFVRISTELPTANTPKPKQHPLKFIARAFEAEVAVEGNYSSLWSQLKNVGTNGTTEKKEVLTDTHSVLSRIFDDDTLRLLSLIPLDSKDSPKTITLAAPSARENRPVRRRSTSLGPASKTNGQAVAAVAAVNGHYSPASPTPASIPLPASPTDWANFSTSGFGEVSLGNDFASTLLDSDVEVTEPPSQFKRRGSNKRKATSSPATSRRSSVDNPRPLAQQRPTAAEVSPTDILKTARTQATIINVVKLDEAFIDFWSDAFTDPMITSNWPTFVLCQLKANLPLTTTTVEGKPINWVVIEQVFTSPPPPPAPVTEPTSPTSSKRPSSPRPSVISNISSRKSSTFSSRPRFGFFGGSSEKSTTSPVGTPKTSFSLMSPGGRKRAAKAPRVGEMGEVLAEIEESPKPAASENALGLGISTVEVTKAKTPEPVTGDAPTSKTNNVPGVVPHTLLASVPEDDKKEEVPLVHALPEVVPAAQATADPELPKVTEPPVADGQSVPVADAKVSTGPVETDVTTSSVTETELSPVPVIDAVPTSVPDAPAPVAVELIALVEERPTISPSRAATEVLQDAIPTTDNTGTLPPAPESVVLSGSTPGAQVALNTIESVAEPHVESQTPIPAPVAQVEEEIPAPDFIGIDSVAVEQKEGDAASTPTTLPSTAVDQVDDHTTSVPVPEIPLDAPTVNETVKDGEHPAISESVELPSSDILGDTPVGDAAPEQVDDIPAQYADATVLVSVHDDPDASATLTALTARAEPVTVLTSTSSENEGATEPLPRAADSDLAVPLSAEANPEPAAAVSAEAEATDASVELAQVVEDVSLATAPKARPEVVESNMENQVEDDIFAAGASPPALQKPVDPPPPTTGDLNEPTPVNVSESAEETPGAMLSSERSYEVDTSATESINAAPEEATTVSVDAGSAQVVDEVDEDKTETEDAHVLAAEKEEDEEEKP